MTAEEARKRSAQRKKELIEEKIAAEKERQALDEAKKEKWFAVEKAACIEAIDDAISKAVHDANNRAFLHLCSCENKEVLHKHMQLAIMLIDYYVNLGYGCKTFRETSKTFYSEGDNIDFKIVVEW